MTIRVLLICESPEENKRKMWGAIYNSRTPFVETRWGRIPHGRNLSTHYIFTNAGQRLDVPVENDEKAVKFIDKKVKEKIAKGYATVEYEHDGLPITFLCDNQPDENGKVKMQTWAGK